MINTLKAEHIYFSYNNTKIINGANFTIKSGINLLLGENGAGKSTIIKLLANIYKTSSGTIKLNNINYNNELAIKKNVGYVPQNFNSFQNIKVKEYLSFMSKFNQGDKIDLSLLEIDDFSNKYLRELSEGMKKRVTVGAALSMNPLVLIADEPTSGLDKNGRNKLRNLFSKINKKYPDKIIIFSSHLDEDNFVDVESVYEIKDGLIFKND